MNETSAYSFDQNKDSNLNNLNPKFDFEKSITSGEIKYEDELIDSKNLTDEKEDNNTFPLEVFPPEVQQIIKDTNKNLNYPIDFIGSSMLFATSIAIGNTTKVEIKKGFQEGAGMYMAIVASPGTNKSHPLTFALQPIIEKDKKSYRHYEEQKKEYDNFFGLPKKERDPELEEPVRPFWQKHIVSDFTPEALTEVHKYNKRGIGVYVDELAGWYKNFNRYTNGSEMEFWLSVWSGKPISIDRKTNEPVFIPLPYISVGGTIQKGILNLLAKDSRTQNGFLDRILFVMPDSIQKTYWNEAEINIESINNWAQIITNILNLSYDLDESLNPIPEILRLDPEAKRLLYAWQKRNTDQCNNAESETISGIYSKLEIYAVRLALILEIMNWACGNSEKVDISTKSMDGALKLIEYFKKSALKVHSIISNNNPLEKYPVNKQELYNALPDNFTTEQGLQIAKNLGEPARTFGRFLKEKELFICPKRGHYEKRI